MRKYRYLVIALMIALPCVAQSWQDTVTLIEKSMSRYQPKNPGCQLSISRNGEIIFSKAWGMADLEHAIPPTIMQDGGIKHDSLNIYIKPGLDFQLQPTYRDAFNIPGLGGNLYFERNKNNKREKMKISISRARNVEFCKVE